MPKKKFIFLIASIFTIVLIVGLTYATFSLFAKSPKSNFNSVPDTNIAPNLSQIASSSLNSKNISTSNISSKRFSQNQSGQPQLSKLPQEVLASMEIVKLPGTEYYNDIDLRHSRSIIYHNQNYYWQKDYSYKNQTNRWFPAGDKFDFGLQKYSPNTNKVEEVIFRDSKNSCRELYDNLKKTIKNDQNPYAALGILPNPDYLGSYINDQDQIYVYSPAPNFGIDKTKGGVILNLNDQSLECDGAADSLPKGVESKINSFIANEQVGLGEKSQIQNFAFEGDYLYGMHYKNEELTANQIPYITKYDGRKYEFLFPAFDVGQYCEGQKIPPSYIVDGFIDYFFINPDCQEVNIPTFSFIRQDIKTGEKVVELIKADRTKLSNFKSLQNLKLKFSLEARVADLSESLVLKDRKNQLKAKLGRTVKTLKQEFDVREKIEVENYATPNDCPSSGLSLVGNMNAKVEFVIGADVKGKVLEVKEIKCTPLYPSESWTGFTKTFYKVAWEGGKTGWTGGYNVIIVE